MPEKASACGLRRGSNQLSFPIAPRSPAAKLKLLVEEQVAGRLAILHRQRGESLILGVKLHHAPQIDRADDIDIVQNERLFASRTLKKKMRGLFQAAAGIEQDLFARDFNPHAEIVVRLQIIDEPCRQSDAH